ncbi:MAG: class I SAM-dependent methyltransferase [Rubrivivax sp.]|nr:class I SAM-dependent methyltransferase [Rubrivivax sp.]
MSDSTAFFIPDLPFHFGPTLSPFNPGGLPDTFPFELNFDPESGMLVQRSRPGLQGLLDRAYRAGQEIGTPLADDALGKPYADDFLAFIRSRAGTPGRALEIGAGVGYLSKRLKDDGWQVDSLEPGIGYQDHWAKYGIDVINEYFPSPRARGPYDLICAYAVLEHIPEPGSLLASVRDHLRPGGTLVLSVPDCSKEIAIGDPAMLIHEHYNYFDATSLHLMLARCGFTANVRPSGYGRAVYASANAAPPPASTVAGVSADTEAARTFPARCTAFTQQARTALGALAARGTLGIYCPSRALAVLPVDISCRFFDDSPSLQGRYVPPFAARIESRAALLDHPTDAVVIMSHTFVEKLKRELTTVLPRSRVFGIAELVEHGVDQRVN